MDEDKQGILAEYLPTPSDLNRLSGLFSAFADKTRLKILSALAVSPLCVNDLCCVLSLNQTTLSHQLSTLRLLGMVEDERRGKTVVYRLKGELVPRLLLLAVEALQENSSLFPPISAQNVIW